ncbi:MAG: HDIG domain-containing protein [Sphingobacteriaceae bacterium]|nr:MAG: HDIG domain-containing protein [Pedobacter sp.]
MKVVRRTNSYRLVYRRYAQTFKYVMISLSVLIIALVLPKQARFRFEFEKGKIWMQNDLIAPYRFAIKKTNAEIEKDRQDILHSLHPVYQNNQEIVHKSIDDFNTDFEVKWKGALVPESQKATYKTFGNLLLRNIYSRGVMLLIKKYQQNNSNYPFTLLTNNAAQHINTADAYTVETGLKYAEQMINKYPSIKNKSWLLGRIENHLQVNYVYDEHLMDKIETEALLNISLTRGVVQKGELIIAHEATINADTYQKLESLRDAENTRVIGDFRVILLGQFLLVGLIISLLVVFLYLFRRDIYYSNRQLSIILLVITGMLIVLSWSLKVKLPSVYYIPYCIVPIIIRILFDTRLALNIHLLVVLIAGFFVPNSFEFAFLQITAGMVSIYSIKNLVKREQFLVSALLILCNYSVAYLGISFIRNGSIDQVEWINFIPFIFSVTLSLLAYPLIYAFEALFGITSDVSLMELTNTNMKLLRDLAYKAPGTFQHSLQVANLAEAAIFKIGGNALLVRAGALYHDIGKMDNPQYFIENQSTGYNPHDILSYEESAQIIIQHVNKGIEIARKHRVPEMVIDFIRTHHGNTRVDYFYQSFLKNFPEQLVDENTFRYPGPIPFSKETAILMLADSVEAASRSLKEPDDQRISDLVERIINYKLDQNQLINSDITLKDIETIKSIFKAMLIGARHIRVDYTLK